MKFGVILSGFEPRGQDPANMVKEWLEKARLARDAGFDSIFIGQHYHVGPVRGPDEVTAVCLQPVPMLARVAAECGDMTLGLSTLLLPFYHPIQVAEEIATLDAICEGRLRFGVAVGWARHEFEVFGIPKEERVSRFEEGLEVVKKLLTEEEVNFEGKHFTLHGIRMNNRPIQKPRPPIWIGGMADASVRRAARAGDSWILSSFASPSDIERHMSIYKESLAELGKPFPQELPALRAIYIAKDRATVAREIIPVLQHTYKSMEQWGWFLMQKGNVETYWKGVQPEWIVGDPDDCIEQISKYEELGINHIIVTQAAQGVTQSLRLETIRLMGERVLPYFKKRHKSSH